MPISWYGKSKKKHPHVIVLQGKKKNYSLGLTHDSEDGKLREVFYSDGSKGYIKRNVTHDDVVKYDKKVLDIKLDKESEEYAYKKAIIKMLKDLENKNK